MSGVLYEERSVDVGVFSDGTCLEHEILCPAVIGSHLVGDW